MNANFINKRLTSFSELFYGKEAECYSKCVKKKKKESYIFGSKKLKIENKVTKEFALYIISGQLPTGLLKKIRYQVMYRSCETGTMFYHACGGVFTEDKAIAEIKILKQEQKHLKKLGLPKTKTDFAKKQITIV